MHSVDQIGAHLFPKKGKEKLWEYKPHGFYLIEDADHDFGKCVVVDWWEHQDCGQYNGGGFAIRMYQIDNTYLKLEFDRPQTDKIKPSYIEKLIHEAIANRRDALSRNAKELLQIQESMRTVPKIAINAQEIIEYLATVSPEAVEKIMPVFYALLDSKKGDGNA